jgi:hypothetical protein
VAKHGMNSIGNGGGDELEVPSPVLEKIDVCYQRLDQQHREKGSEESNRVSIKLTRMYAC